MSKTRNFRVLWLDLDANFLYHGHNLFQILQDNVVYPNSEVMADQTLVATVRPKGGFYILNSMPDLHPGTGAGEQLLDETCSM